MIFITGIGWITKKEYGCVIQGMHKNYDNLNLLNSRLYHESFFLYPIKNFGRFDTSSKIVCCACTLALHDASILYSKHRKQDIGIIGTNIAGSFPSDVCYFKDYVQSGRMLARGNLFIYTLPSSPLAEVAIYFGFQGPLLHITFSQKQVSSLLQCAGKMILRQEATAMLVVNVGEEEATCFVLRQKEDVPSKKAFNLGEAIVITQKTSRLDEMIKEFTEAAL